MLKNSFQRICVDQLIFFFLRESAESVLMCDILQIMENIIVIVGLSSHFSSLIIKIYQFNTIFPDRPIRLKRLDFLKPANEESARLLSLCNAPT